MHELLETVFSLLFGAAAAWCIGVLAFFTCMGWWPWRAPMSGPDVEAIRLVVAEAIAAERMAERKRANHYARCGDLKCHVCEEYRALLDEIEDAA